MAHQKKGDTQTILRVDLSSSQTRVETVASNIVDKYIGGRGLGAYLLYREVPAKVDPLSPQNKLIFLNGPLVGSLVPGSNKVNVTFKSPLTGTYSYSLCGGHWGPALRAAGFDGVIIEGKAEQPTYLLINNGSVELRSAATLWGETIPRTEEAIRQELTTRTERTEHGDQDGRATQMVS